MEWLVNKSNALDTLNGKDISLEVLRPSVILD